MFTDEEKRAYHNIKAPDTLYQRITAKSKTPRRVWYGLAAMAASLLLIVTSVVMQGQSDIIVNGRKLTDSVEFYVATAGMERSVSSAVSVPWNRVSRAGPRYPLTAALCAPRTENRVRRS